jgi:hypothetical protein
MHLHAVGEVMFAKDYQKLILYNIKDANFSDQTGQKRQTGRRKLFSCTISYRAGKEEKIKKL